MTWTLIADAHDGTRSRRSGGPDRKWPRVPALGHEVNYREIQPEDIAAIFDVRTRTWHNPNGAAELERMGITPDSVCAMLGKSHRGWLAETKGNVVGFAMGNRDTGEMWVIAVLKEYENQGIGRTLLRLVEDWLASEGCHELWLTTDPDENFRAVGFYRRLGWEDWKIEGGDRFMRKRIAGPTPPSAARTDYSSTADDADRHG